MLKSLLAGILALIAATFGLPRLPVATAPNPVAPPAHTQTAAAVAATSNVGAPDTGPYTVEAGDTISGIAEQFGVSEASVLAANHFKKTSLLKVGQKLRIPATPPLAASPFASGSNTTNAGAPDLQQSNAAALNSKLNTLASVVGNIVSLLPSLRGSEQEGQDAAASIPLGDGAPNTIAAASNIGQLTNVTVSGISGLTVGEIPALSYLPLAGGTISGAFIDSATASSTFAGAIGVGTSTPGSIFSVQGVGNWTTATSTFYSTGGINLSGGCFAIAGNCVGLGSFSGTLGVNQGGTGWTNISSGSIPFGNDASALATSSNLFWDNIDGRLGIGTTSPTAILTLDSSSPNGTIMRVSNSSTGGHIYDWLSTGSANTGGAGRLDLFDYTAGAARLSITSSGSVGVSTTSPSAMFAVSGTSYFGGGISGVSTVLLAPTTTLSDHQSVFEITGTTNSTNTNNDFAVNINPTMHPTAAVNGGGLRVAPTLGGSDPTLTSGWNVITSSVTIDPSWSGTTPIPLVALFNPASITNTGNVPISNFQEYASTQSACNDGATLVVVCSGLNLAPFTGSASTAGTLGNYGIAVQLSTGSASGTGAVTNNYAIKISGNGGAAGTSGGTTNNYAIYDGSTAPIYFNGSLGIGTTSPESLLALQGVTPAISLVNAGDRNWQLRAGAAAFGTFDFFDGTAGLTRIAITSSGNVGIGTSTPAAPLTVESASGSSANSEEVLRLVANQGNGTPGSGPEINFDNVNNLNTGYIRSVAEAVTGIEDLSFGAFQSGNGLREIMRVSGTGDVGIGTSSPSARLTVWGPDTASTTAFNVVNSASTTVFAVYDSGNSTYSGSIFQSSDQRLKTNVVPLDGSSSLSAIEQLNPVSYLRVDQPGQGANLGFLAQAVQTVFPELVSVTAPTSLTPDGTLTLNYTGLIAPIVSSIQEIANISGDFEQNLIAWLGSASNGIQDLVANNVYAQNITANVVNSRQDNTQKLCIGTTCINQAQLAAFVAAEGGSPSTGVGESGASTAAVTSAPDTSPILQINGDNPAIVTIGATYNDLGATITGPQADLNLELVTYLNGVLENPIVVDTSEPATDTISYVATDSQGLSASSTRTVIIQAPAADGGGTATSTP
jgi:LysM repeat protein